MDRDPDGIAKSSEAAALAVYALIGAAVATLGVALVETRSSAAPQDAGPAASSSASTRACPLTASPPACDACMLTVCLPACQACASNPACLRLFACIMDCGDERCEQGCVSRHPEGVSDLVAFVGSRGCLVQRCPVVCP